MYNTINIFFICFSHVFLIFNYSNFDIRMFVLRLPIFVQVSKKKIGIIKKRLFGTQELICNLKILCVTPCVTILLIFNPESLQILFALFHRCMILLTFYNFFHLTLKSLGKRGWMPLQQHK